MSFTLGRTSRNNLVGVHPDLVVVVHRAIEVTLVDFTVFDGLRTEAEQRELVRTGASKTLRSKHLKQKTGYGHAVDLVPWVAGKLRWEMPLCIGIARAMAKASDEKGVDLIWGGGWDVLGRDDPSHMVEAYAERKRLVGEPPFFDGPHFQLR